MTSRGRRLMVGAGKGGRCLACLSDRTAPRLELMVLAEPAIRSSLLMANFVCARRQTDIDWSKCPWVGNIWNENPPRKHKVSASYVSGMQCEKRGLWKWGGGGKKDKDIYNICCTPRFPSAPVFFFQMPVFLFQEKGTLASEWKGKISTS